MSSGRVPVARNRSIHGNSASLKDSRLRGLRLPTQLSTRIV